MPPPSSPSDPFAHLSSLVAASELLVEQQREVIELLGVETRNRYILRAAGRTVGFAEERGGGLAGFFGRQWFGHYRGFEIDVSNVQGTPFLRVLRPFRWWMMRLEVHDATTGRRLGAIQQRWSFLRRRFDVLDASDHPLMCVSSPWWKPWTFPFDRDGVTVALVQKKWAGLLTESFLDADRFRVVFETASLGTLSRLLVVAAALFIDLQYFERKAD